MNAPKLIAHTPAAPYCRLPIGSPSRAYVPACKTNVAETFRQFEPIRVSAINGAMK